MGLVMGIDIGGSTTKIVGFDHGRLIGTLQVKASDQMTSAYGAFGKFLNAHDLKIRDVERVAFTGVGASFIKGNFYSLPTSRAGEFQAIGSGGQYLSGFKRAIIVSMGTGTAFVKVADGQYSHLGGSGIGGGTLVGLCDRMIGVRNFDNIISIAKNGDLSRIDLTIGDISMDKLPNMPMDATASNFGGLSDRATDADIAAGILNLVFQTIGVMAIFAARGDGIRDIVLTGTLTAFPSAEISFRQLELLHGVKFLIPEHAEYATAIGAALV